MSIKYLFKSKLWLFPLGYCLFFLVEAIADVFFGNKSLHKAFHFVEQSFFVLIILALIKSLLKKTNIHWLAIIVASILIFFAHDIRFHVYILSQSLRIKFSPNIFSSCIKNATPLADGGVIGVCEYTEQRAIGTELGINTSYVSTAFIYDSSDQIIRNETKRTREWYLTVCSFRKKVPFGRSGFHTTKLFGHYYYVVFNTELTGVGILPFLKYCKN